MYHILYLLQCISPVILTRSNVNMANLINDLSHVTGCCEQDIVDRVKDHVLSIVSGATVDSLSSIISSGTGLCSKLPVYITLLNTVLLITN